MALNKENLKDDIYDDLSQTQTVLSVDSTNSSLRVPSNYEYNVTPFKVEGNDASEALDVNRGEVVTSTFVTDVETDEITSSSDPDTVAATAAIDATRNNAEALAWRLRIERNATVLADRIIQHLLDNLETKEAADNVVLLRQMIQFLTERVLNINESVNTLANHTAFLSDAVNTLIQGVTDVATGASTATAANIALLTRATTNMATLTTKAVTANIVDEAGDINSTYDNVTNDLEEGSYPDSLESITYASSENII